MKKPYWGLVLLLAMQSAMGLELVPEASSLNFISIKKSSIAELNTFTALQGSLDEKGDLHLTVGLASVNTGIPTRDDRIREFFFQVPQYPEATIYATISPAKYSGLKPGEEVLLEVEATLDLHGVSQVVKSSLRVIRMANGQLLATTVHPILLNIAEFNLGAGLEKLRGLASLPSIDSIIPVYFELVFDSD